MSFATWTFRVAGIYGLIVILPLYGLEQRIGLDAPPAITHPEYFYGFIGTTAVMLLIYLLISTNPPRYRPLMPISVLAKLSFVVPAVLLAMQGRLRGAPLVLSGVDLALGALGPRPNQRSPMNQHSF